MTRIFGVSLVRGLHSFCFHRMRGMHRCTHFRSRDQRYKNRPFLEEALRRVIERYGPMPRALEQLRKLPRVRNQAGSIDKECLRKHLNPMCKKRLWHKKQLGTFHFSSSMKVGTMPPPAVTFASSEVESLVNACPTTPLNRSGSRSTSCSII